MWVAHATDWCLERDVLSSLEMSEIAAQGEESSISTVVLNIGRSLVYSQQTRRIVGC